MSTNTEKDGTETNTAEQSSNEEVTETQDDSTVENNEKTEDVQIDENSESEDSSEEVSLPSVEELIKEREQLKAKVEEWKGLYYKINDAFQKKTTEVQDTRKRLERMNEVNQAKLRGQVVSNIFSPFENLKRSIDACTKAGVDEGLTNGLGMVKDEFWSAFQKLGLEEIPGVGSLFNPNIHEALTTMPVMDPVLNDTVVQVYTTGYRINDTVVRTSQVIVGKYTAPPEPKETESEESTTSADSLNGDNNQGEDDSSSDV